MIDDDFKYVLDENGQRVLVGLTPSETVEFERLESLRRDSSIEPSVVSVEAALQPPRGKRWLEVFERHELARSALIEAQRATKHQVVRIETPWAAHRVGLARRRAAADLSRASPRCYVGQTVLRLLTNRLPQNRTALVLAAPSGQRFPVSLLRKRIGFLRPRYQFCQGS
jgi:hypothetical protein